MKKKSKLMECGHWWIPKRGLKTKGMCLDCYKSYLERLQRYSDRDIRMKHTRANTFFAANTVCNEETKLMAFFDCVMPEIPIHRALKLSKEVANSHNKQSESRRVRTIYPSEK